MIASDEELASLRESLRQALGLDRPDARLDVESPWRERWPALAKVGLLGFCVPEDFDGLGCEASASLVASRELGAALHGGPYAAAVAAVFVLSRGLDSAGRAAVVAEVLSGASVVALAQLEPGAAIRRGEGGARVDGRARFVLGGEDADAFVIVGPGRDWLGYVRRDACCSLEAHHAFDVTRSCADLAFRDAHALSIAVPPATLDAMSLLYRLLLAGDALGGAAHMLERTTAYARERVAFGRPIGAFQAVQHRLVDHALALRGRSLLAQAAARAITAGAPDAERLTLLAEAGVSAGVVPLLHDLVQLTGAIGFTWEHGLHLFERRAHADARAAQNPRRALRGIAEVERWSAIAAQPLASPLALRPEPRA